MRKLTPFNKNRTISSFQKRVKNRRKKNGTIAEKCQNSSTKIIPFLKRAKIPQQKWYHFLKESKFLDKNGTISVRKGSKFLNKNSTITEKGQKSSTKMVPFQERVKTLNKNGIISENGQNSSTKMVPFQAKKGQNSSTK